MENQNDHERRGVPAKPREELHNLAKNIADCTELHLARRGITHLTDDMEAFESLEVLWVNDNSLSRITNLDYNPTIKSLYAHNNRIGTLKGSLLAFAFLHTLTLGNNRIGNLQASLSILRLMRHLRYLELSGNPLAEETGYRLLVIKNLPWLETLDMHKITEEERIAARRARVPKSWEASAHGSHGDSVQVAQDLAAKENAPQTQSEKSRSGQRRSVDGGNSNLAPASYADSRHAQALLRQELHRMRAVVKLRRILLKEWFVAEDARREEVVTQDLFTKCLRLHGLWPASGGDAVNTDTCSEGEQNSPRRSTNTAPCTGFLSGKAGLLGGLLLEAFRAPVPRRAVVLGRDAAYLEQGFLNYVSFCAAVEPKHGGRDLDNQSRILDKAWKTKRKEPLSVVSRMKKLAGEQPPPQLSARHSGSGRSCGGGGYGGGSGTEPSPQRRDTKVLPNRAPMACKFTKTQTAGGPGQLDYWERIELKRIMESQAGDAQQLLSRAQFFSSIKKMVNHGRRARVSRVDISASIDDDSINNLSGSGGAEGGGRSVAVTTDGSDKTNLDVLFDAAAALSSPAVPPPSASGNSGRGGAKGKGGSGEGQEEGDAKAAVKWLLLALEDGTTSTVVVGPLEWDWLSCEEARDRAKKIYRQASHAQRLMLLISDDEDEAVRQEAGRIRSKIATLTRDAARLEALASTSRSPSWNPADIGGSGPRIDPRGAVPSPASLRLGRVDVFFATEFHGGPFQEQEDDAERRANGGRGSGGGSSVGADPAVAASISQYACDATLSTNMSLDTAERTPVGGGGGGRGGGGDVSGPERPWFSRRLLTAG